MMWFVLLLLCCAHCQEMNLKGTVKVILQGGSRPCEGHVEVYYKDMLGHVGDLGWNRSTEEVVCRSTYCGTPVHNATVDVSKVTEQVWLNDLKCKGDEEDLLYCDSPGLNISQYRKTTVKKMQCSYNVKIGLDRLRCSGVVQYSIQEEQISGYFCDEKWGEREANHLCQSLGCGHYEEIPKVEWVEPENFKYSRNILIDCSKITDLTHLWQCVTTDLHRPPRCRYPARVTCTGHDRLQLKGSPSDVCSGQLETRKGTKWVPFKDNTTSPHLKCQQMHCGSFGSLNPDNQQLKCSDTISVVLTDELSETKCYGTVAIKVNGSINAVCNTTWTQKESETVCRELGCGGVASMTSSGVGMGLAPGIMDHVQCKGDESSLWHCQAQHGRGIRCRATPFIICSGSVDVKLADGPGRCAGRLELRYTNRWRRVLNSKWDDKYSDAVCKQLNCGERSLTAGAERYSSGSGSFVAVACQSKYQRISECTITEPPFPQTTAEAVGITCEGHKVVFLNGTKACSGDVGIKHGKKTYWLSGSSTTWNPQSANAVCHQMQCGDASKVNSKPRTDATDAVWGEAYNCSSTKGDLFDCNTTEPPSDHNRSIASVICAETRSVNLSNGCWGTVEVCSGGECWKVCGESWTQEKDEMLCQSLGCGKVLQAYKRPKTGNILYKSLHTTDHTNDLSQCNFVKKEENDNSCDQNPAYVVCSGSVKPRFEESRDKCYGNVVVDYEGQPVPMCKEALEDIKTRNAICRQLNCGNGLGVFPYFESVSRLRSLVISNLQCAANDTGLWSTCDITSKKKSCSYGSLKCSDSKKMNFKDTCGGEVVIYSQDKRQLVSTEGWSDKEGQRLCDDMNCGEFKSKEGIPPQPDEENSFWNRSFSCGNESIANIWDCERKTAPLKKEKLFIKCQDESKVTLSKRCYGQLRIRNTSVCGHNWGNQYSLMVCQELGCGEALVDATPDYLPAPPNSYHVKCDEHHYKLGQCKRVQGACEGKTAVSVYCVDNIEFNTTQYCGGVLQVKYQTEWKNVCGPVKLPPNMKDKLCKEMRCGDHIANIKNSNDNNKVNLEMTLQCTPETFNIKYCVKKQPCNNVFPAEIYCQGYVKPTEPPTTSPNLTAGVIGGVFFVIMLIVTLTILGFCMMKKIRNSARMLPKDELESGSYAEVPSRGNEKENSSRSRLRSDAEDVLNENEAPSISSVSYDDVDKAPETWPLTGGTAILAPANSLLQKDGETDEIDDALESYDDIGETEADSEVHHNPNAPTESDAAGPPGPEEEDENYIVPG